MADPPLPPDFTLQKLTQAQRAFESALGSSKVFFEDLDRTGYKDKFAVNDAAHLPAGAIGPTTVEEVQAALRIANQYRLPVWPISRGKNLGYGGSAPAARLFKEFGFTVDNVVAKALALVEPA